MSGKIPVRIVSDGDGSGTLQRVGVDFGRNHNFEVVTAADQRAGGHICMTQAVATALGVSAAALPLDGIAAPAMAVSTARRLATSYTGPLIRVRNGSAVEADIAYNGSNELNTTALLTHTGSGGADTGSVVRAYGQVGTIDGFTSTTANQPWIVQAGAINTLGGKPACDPQTAGSSLTTVTAGGAVAASLPGASQDDFTFLIVMTGAATSGTRDMYRFGGNGIELYAFEPNAGGNRARVDVGATAVASASGVNAPGSNPQVFSIRRSAGTVSLFRNSEGTALASGAAATLLDAVQYMIFSGLTSSAYTEFMWWNSALSLVQFDAIRANCVTFYGATYP
jgi:hypothetical protein